MFQPELPELDSQYKIEQDKNGLTIYLEKVFEGEEKNEQERRVLQYLSLLKNELMNEENYIDQGGLAKVYSMGDRDICIKIMRNRHLSANPNAYDLGAKPLEEFVIMETLHGFDRGGIRAPIPEACIESGDSSAIIMERLDAVNLQHVLNGQEKMPEGFKSREFFTSLDEYLNALHSEKGIAHMDLYPRNIMIDRKTGKAFVIDFGRAQRIFNLGEDEKQKRIDADFDRYDEMFGELEKFDGGKEVKKEIIPNRHEIHHFGRQTKIAFSKHLKKEAMKIAKTMLDNNETMSFLPLGEAKNDLVISIDKSLVVGHHHFVFQGIDFYVGVGNKKEGE